MFMNSVIFTCPSHAVISTITMLFPSHHAFLRGKKSSYKTCAAMVSMHWSCYQFCVHSTLFVVSWICIFKRSKIKKNIQQRKNERSLQNVHYFVLIFHYVTLLFNSINYQHFLGISNENIVI